MLYLRWAGTKIRQTQSLTESMPCWRAWCRKMTCAKWFAPSSRTTGLIQGKSSFTWHQHSTDETNRSGSTDERSRRQNFMPTMLWLQVTTCSNHQAALAIITQPICSRTRLETLSMQLLLRSNRQWCRCREGKVPPTDKIAEAQAQPILTRDTIVQTLDKGMQPSFQRK